MQQCKLCLRHVPRLEKSHFLPAGVYRILRDDGEKNPNPWQLTRTNSVQTSWQMKAPLLCFDCEQRLCKHGEAWVLAHCLKKNGAFPLASILAGRSTALASDETTTRIYHAFGIPEININAISYFAASMFWRGSIHPWNEDGTCPVSLGPFQEQFRQYLMELQPFPKDCALWVAVRQEKEIDRLTYAPFGERQGNIHVYKFPIPGLAFLTAVSKNIPSNFRDRCFVHGHGNPLIVTELLENLLIADAAKMREQAHIRVPLEKVDA
jgi:hypothetical protein